MGSPLMAIALGALSGVNSNREAARAAAREQRQQDLLLRRQQGEDFDRAARLYGAEALVPDDDELDATGAAAGGSSAMPRLTPGGTRPTTAGHLNAARGPALVATPKSASTSATAAPAASFAASFDDAGEQGTTQQGVTQAGAALPPAPKVGSVVLDNASNALRVMAGGRSFRVDPSRSTRVRQETERQAHDVANREAAAALRTADPDAWGASYDPQFDYRKAHQQVLQETSNVKSLVASGYAKTEDEARLLIRKGIDVQDRRDKREAARLAREAQGVQASKEKRERTDWSEKRKQKEASGSATAWAESGATVKQITDGIAKFYPDIPSGLRAGIAAEAVQESRKAKSPAQPERPRASTRRPATTRPAAAGGAAPATALEPLTDVQVARAKTDPLYAQFLREKGYK